MAGIENKARPTSESWPGCARHAGITWRIGMEMWGTDDEFLQFRDFIIERRLTGKLSFFLGSHVPLALERVRGLCATLARRISSMQELGYETGINILSTLGHVDETLENCVHVPGARKFTTCGGDVAKGQFCPTDPIYREKYLQPLYEMLARTGADFVWSDDDIRLENHGPQGWGCLCDGCMGQIRKALGFDGTRAEFAEWLDDPAEGNVRRRRYMQFRRETVADLIGYLARVVRRANPKTVFGIMDATFYDQVPYPEKFAAAEGGSFPIYWRPGGGFYRDERPDDILAKANGLAFECAWIPDGVASLEAEIEDFDYQRLHKSVHFNVLEAELYCAVATRGVAYNVMCSPLRCGDIRCNVPVVSALEARRQTLDAYVEAAGNARAFGVYSGKGRDYCLAKNMRPGQSWLAAPVDDAGIAPFLGSELQRIGIPAAYRQAEAQIFALNGRAVRTMSDGEIASMLSSAAYLSADAAEELVRRGYGRDIGFKVAGPATGEADFESYADHPLNAGFAGLKHYGGSGFWGGAAFDLEPLPGALTLMHGGPRHPCVAGTFENSRGGRVCVNGYFPWDRLSNEVRSEQMKRVFRWLSRDRISGYVASFHRISLWVRGSHVAVLLNMSADPAQNVELALNKSVAGQTLETVCAEASQKHRIFGKDDGAYWRYSLPEISPWTILVLKLK